MSRLTLIQAAILPGLLGFTAACAHAMPVETGERAIVRYADLDLGTEAGQKELKRRIKRAASSVCGVREARIATRLPSLEARDCYRKALEDIRPQFARVLETSRGGA